MFKPHYKLTNRLLNNLIDSARGYGKLESLNLPSKIELNIKKKHLLTSTYISNSIEGNQLNLNQVENLITSQRVAINRDEQEVVNYFNILARLDEYVSSAYSLLTILSFHKQLLTGVNDDIAGLVRDKKVVVGRYLEEGEQVSINIKHNPPHHNKQDIQTQLSILLEWLSKTQDIPSLLKAGIFHHHFVYIHPFVDGNGRVCRLMTALILLKEGYRINDYFMLDDYYDCDRQAYSDKLHTADAGDKTEWLEYFTQGVKYSLSQAFTRYKDSTLNLKVENRPTAKEQEVLNIMLEYKELRSSDLVDKLNISRQQAHHLLSNLVDKKLITKHGATKSSYYTLS